MPSPQEPEYGRRPARKRKKRGVSPNRMPPVVAWSIGLAIAIAVGVVAFFAVRSVRKAEPTEIADAKGEAVKVPPAFQPVPSRGQKPVPVLKKSPDFKVDPAYAAMLGDEEQINGWRLRVPNPHYSPMLPLAGVVVGDGLLQRLSGFLHRPTAHRPLPPRRFFVLSLGYPVQT